MANKRTIPEAERFTLYCHDETNTAIHIPQPLMKKLRKHIDSKKIIAGFGVDEAFQIVLLDYNYDELISLINQHGGSN